MASRLATRSTFAGPSGDAARVFTVARWPLIVAFVAGSIAWVSTDLLRWPRALFLVPYVAAACVLSSVFVRRHLQLASVIGRNPLRTAVTTLITAVLMIATVLLQPGAAPSTGVRLMAEIVWDGLAYGAADGLLLTVLPMAAVTHTRGTSGRVTDALALVASMFVYIVYHLGFREFRGPGLVAPFIASLVFGAAFLVARNPLAPIVSHAAMHVVAVLHGPAGTLQLPPHF